MNTYEWLGHNGDAQPLSTYSEGTGQSGTVALTTTANNVLTNSKALAVTQQTSSGTGMSRGSLVIPRPLGLRKLRFSWVYRVLVDDVNFYTLTFLVYDFDGTNSRRYQITQNSNLGNTEQIQYYNSSGALVNTGFAYPPDQGTYNIAWHRIGFDVDLTAKTYTRLFLDSQFDLSAKDAQEGSNASAPAISIFHDIAGNTVLSTLLIDSIEVGVFE